MPFSLALQDQNETTSYFQNDFYHTYSNTMILSLLSAGNKSLQSISSWKSRSSTTSKPRVTSVGKPSLSVTKISKKKVGLRWTRVYGASGYKVYRKNKLIKTVSASTTSMIYTKKGAGSASYKVAATYKPDGKTVKTGPFSSSRKGKKNLKTYYVNKNMSSVSYGYAPFRISKIVVTGKKYKVTGYVVNNRMFKVLRYKRLKVKIYCNGKVVAKKTFKNMSKAKCKAYGTKKVTFTIKGKSGVDFRNAQGTTWTTDTTPYWEGVGTKTFN